EEQRMQETLASQDTEIRQYNADLIAAQASDRQRQRDNLENGRPLGTSYTQRSGYGATTSNDTGWTTQYPSLPDKSTTLYSGPQPGNNPLHYGRDRHDLRLIQSASSQSSTTNALGAGSSIQLPPNEYTFDGAPYQGPSQQHDAEPSNNLVMRPPQVLGSGHVGLVTGVSTVMTLPLIPGHALPARHAEGVTLNCYLGELHTTERS
ncbi:MAG: hypothetical protein LQ349_002356, partial [Xanthoria aureola]